MWFTLRLLALLIFVAADVALDYETTVASMNADFCVKLFTRNLGGMGCQSGDRQGNTGVLVGFNSLEDAGESVDFPKNFIAILPGFLFNPHVILLLQSNNRLNGIAIYDEDALTRRNYSTDFQKPYQSQRLWNIVGDGILRESLR